MNRKNNDFSIVDALHLLLNEELLDEQILNETKRLQFISKSRKGAQYKSKKGNRWSAKINCKVANTVKEYNKLNMDKFWKNDLLNLGIRVKGETGDYIVKVEFTNILSRLQEKIKQNRNLLELKLIYKSLTEALNSSDVKVSCSCLHPDTKIKLLDGTVPTVEEMKERFDSGEKLYVYSTDEKGDFKPGEVEKVWITSQTDELIKITLDNGKEVQTTPDHLFMLRDGSYVPACDLKENDSLMPMYFSEVNGYEIIKLNSTPFGKNSTYKLVAEEFKQGELAIAKDRSATQDNPMSYAVAIHHKDFNKKNNNPENLQVMTGWEHWAYHANLCGKNRPITQKMRDAAHENAVKRNSSPTTAMLKQREDFIKAGQEHNKKVADHATAEYIKQSEVMREAICKYWDTLSEEDYKKNSVQKAEQTKKLWQDGAFNTIKFHEAAILRGKQLHTTETESLAAEGVRKYWSNISEQEKNIRDLKSKENLKKATEKIKGVPWSEARKKQRSLDRLNESTDIRQARVKKCFETKILSVFNKILSEKAFITVENYLKYKPKNYPGIDKIIAHFGSFDQAVSYFKLNHKVVKIEYITLEKPLSVYDIKVAKWNNFVIDAGIVLHNCPDFKYRLSYWLSQHDEIEGEKENREAQITNPNDNLGAGCKHILCILNNADWLHKISSVINNYVAYAKEHMEDLYARYIFPKLYGMEYKKAIQLCIDDFDENGELKTDLKSDEATLNLANALGKERGKIKKGSNKNPIAQARKKELEKQAKENEK